jgi:hypothetical protein
MVAFDLQKISHVILDYPSCKPQPLIEIAQPPRSEPTLNITSCSNHSHQSGPDEISPVLPLDYDASFLLKKVEPHLTDDCHLLAIRFSAQIPTPILLNNRSFDVQDDFPSIFEAP